MTDPIALRWREALRESVARHSGLPVYLSGGMDSITLVAALVSLGERPLCVTYKMAGLPSADADVARQVTADHWLPWLLVELPTEPETVQADVRTVIRGLGRSGKVAVECAVPMLRMAERLRAYGYSAALAGTGGIVEDNRRYVIATARGETPEWNAYRRQTLLGWAGSGSGVEVMFRASRLGGVMMYQPYAEPPIAELTLSLAPAELNSPRQKGIALRAFPEFFGPADAPRYWQHNHSLQSASGLREVYASAFGRTRRSVIAAYNALRREEDGLWRT